MKKISKSEFEWLLKKFSFYNFLEMRSIYKNMKVSFEEGISSITYSDVLLGEEDDNYYIKEKIIIDFVVKIFCTVGNKNCIIINDNIMWLKNRKIVRSLYHLIKKYGIKNRNTKVICIENEKEIGLFVKSILRYNTFAVFIFPENEFTLGVSDHMDLFLGFKEKSFMDIIKKEIYNFNINNDNIFKEEEI